MTKSNVIDLAGREEDKDPLTALLRTGARTLIHKGRMGKPCNAPLWPEFGRIDQVVCSATIRMTGQDS